MTAPTNHLRSRRDFLQDVAPIALGLNFAGLTLARDAFATSNPGVGARERIKSCILIFYYGGPSHLDTVDMKPEGPSTVRGEFKSISTSVPGIQICEHMPHLAKVIDKVSIVRSMHHTNRLHDSASTAVLVGRDAPNGDVENFAAIEQFYPCYGSAVSYLRRDMNLDVSHAALPHVIHNVIDVPCQGGGFLGAAFDPFRISCDPSKGIYSAKMLNRPAELSLDRLSRRRELLARFGHRVTDETTAAQLDSIYARAYDLLASNVLREAMDIEREDTAMRDRYGFSDGPQSGGGNGAQMAYARNMRGQNLLLARRMVEADVPFVNVYDFRQQGQNWDAHSDCFRQHKEYLLPPAEKALAALIEDLDQRGLLDTTLVVALGEFGRTPQINKAAGRDHWPDCYSILLAGGGVKGGYVHGASDAIGAYVDRDPVTPGDLAATIFWAFGIDPATLIHDRTNRPHTIAAGKPVVKLFA